MALLDIEFNDGDPQNFELELPSGMLNAPMDIEFDASAEFELTLAPGAVDFAF